MSAASRLRLASRLARCLATAALTVPAACAFDDDGPATETPPTTAEQRLVRELARLHALDVFEVDALATTRTEHQWTPYGGFWQSTEVALTADEQADRVGSLADAAEPAVRRVTAADIADSFWDAEGTPSLCTRLQSDEHVGFCLDVELHATNLHRLGQLEIVEVTDIIHSEPATTAFCYSSWTNVSEASCVRALKLGALVEATRDFPSADPPSGEPE
jgi:hypothetical protein